MAKPCASSAASISCGSAPSSSMKSHCARQRAKMRLPMKPSHTPATTATLPSRRASASAVASTSGAVRPPRTISSSFITCAGLKKCSPSTRSGASTTSAIRLMSR